MLLKLKDMAKFKNIDPLNKFVIHISSPSRHNIIHVTVWENEEKYKRNRLFDEIAKCSFKIESNHIRAVTEDDFNNFEAIVGFHEGLFVKPEYRRKGIASSLYCLMEQVTDLKIIPSKDRTKDAVKLWNNPQRIFGI